MSKVYLIGAGPGDPELLTVKAARLLQAADAVVYDRLVGDGVMDLVPAGAARIYVGKGPGRRHMAQDEINELLFRTARPDRTVVRLKGGDPFVFGRGSEEALYLRTRGVQVEVVPGITAASGCCSAAGAPPPAPPFAVGRADGAIPAPPEPPRVSGSGLPPEPPRVRLTAGLLPVPPTGAVPEPKSDAGITVVPVPAGARTAVFWSAFSRASN
jgi:hypothetical protein